MDVAELVKAEQVESAVAGDEAAESSFVCGFGEFVDELGGSDVADAEALFAGGETEPDEEMRFAGARIAEQHDGVTGGDVAAGSECGDDGGFDGRSGVEVEVAEPFDAWEAGVVDAPRSSAFGAGVDFGFEEFG